MIFKNTLSKLATAIFIVAFSFSITVSAVAADETISLTNESSQTNNSTIEMLSNIKIDESADFNKDGTCNILDLIQAKANNRPDQIHFAVDVLENKSIAKSAYDYDSLDAPTYKNLVKMFPIGYTPINFLTLNNEKVLEYYNEEIRELKRIKLSNEFSENTTVYPFVEYDIPWNNSTTTCHIAIDKNGKFGWTSDSFTKPLDEEIYINNIQDSSTAALLIRSITWLNNMKKDIDIVDDKVIVTLYNTNRRIKLIDDLTNVELDSYFYKYTCRINSTREIILVGIAPDNTLAIQYERQNLG